MDMDGVRSCTIAALLFLTLVVLAAAVTSGGGGDDDAAAAVEEERSIRWPTIEPYMLLAFHNKDGEEIRMLADKGTDSLSAAGFANRSGHWFHANRAERSKRKCRRRLPLPIHQSNNNNRSRAEGFWNSIGALADTTDPAAAAAADERYVLVGMQTSGGHKIRLVVVADQRYFFITGFAGFLRPPNWSFRDSERHRLLPSLGNGGSHAEVVASNVLAAMVKEGRAHDAAS